jgi:hypothetical protein
MVLAVVGSLRRRVRFPGAIRFLGHRGALSSFRCGSFCSTIDHASRMPRFAHVVESRTQGKASEIWSVSRAPGNAAEGEEGLPGSRSSAMIV